MNTALLLAIYGAILSTTLGFLTIFNFLRERRTLSVETHFSFEIDLAHYDFVIANVSSRPLTIIDCTIRNVARTETRELQPDWGVEPYVLKSLFEDGKTKKLTLPHILHPGAVLIVGTSSDLVIEQFSFYSKTPIGSKKWTPTERMELEVTHSMSTKPHITKFKLQEKELERLHGATGR